MLSLVRRTSFKAFSRRNLSLFGNMFKFSPDEYIHLYGEKADPNLMNVIKTYGDKEYGGGSNSTISVVSGNESDSGPFIRWTGVKSFDVEHALQSKAKGGYVAFKMFCKERVDLMDLDGFLIEMRVKEDLLLTLNMRCVRSMDLITTYQNSIILKGGSEWQKFFVPFNKLIGVYEGSEKAEDQENDSLQLASFGFIMSSDTWVQGEFEVDIKSLIATKVEKLKELTGGKPPIIHK